MPFDDQRVEIIERIGKFDNHYVFIDFGLTDRTFKKQRCEVAYRVDFIILDDFKRFYNGRKRQNRLIDIEIKRVVHEITYLRFFI